MRVHFEEKHKHVNLTRYEGLWKLSNFERSEMKKIWAKRGKVTTKRTKKSKIPPLTISENHRARIPANPSLSPFPVDEVVGEPEKNDTDDEDMPESECGDFEGEEDVMSMEREDSEEAGEDVLRHASAFVNNFGDLESVSNLPIMQELEPSDGVSD